MNDTDTERAPFDLERLDHLVLRTRDVGRLVDFYCGLGCRVVREIESMQLIQLAAGASIIDIIGVEERAEPAGRNLDHFALRVSPFERESILAYCAAREIPAESPENLLLGADGFGPAIYVEDPDGNRVELKGPPEKPRPDA